MSTQVTLAEPQTLPAEAGNNPWLQAAADAGGGGRILKFIKGTYEVNDVEVPIGTEFVAHIDQLVRGWTRFQDGKVTGQHIGKVKDGYRVPAREEFGDLDQNKWERDTAGQPRDPWVLQWYLPLIAQDGELLTFVTGSKGGIGAIGTLCRVYGRKKRDGLLPIVKLQVRSYRHERYGKIETPDFVIVGWEGLEPSPTPMLEQHGASSYELNDEIPFN
jgi:hypothetical protein